MLVDCVPGQQRDDEKDHANGGHLQYLADTQEAEVEAHQDGKRHGQGGGDHAPRALGQGVVDDQGETGDKDDQNAQDGEHSDGTGGTADFLTHHLGQGLAVASHGREQNDEVLHGTAQHRADQDPQRARQIAELRGQHRTDERAGTADRGEVVPEEHELVGLDEIAAVVVHLGRRGA